MLGIDRLRTLTPTVGFSRWPTGPLRSPEHVVACGQGPGFGPGGLPAQADPAAIAASPFLVDQAGKQVSGCADHFFERGTDRFGDQFQPGQVAHRSHNMGEVGALRSAFARQPRLFQADEWQVEETVGAAFFGEALAEVGEHTVRETGIFRFQGHGVGEIHATADRLCCLPVRHAHQELQNAQGGQLDRGVRHAGTSPPSHRRITARPVLSPHHRRTAWAACLCDSRGRRRDLLTGTGGATADTSVAASVFGTARACPSITQAHWKTPRSPAGSSTEVVPEPLHVNEAGQLLRRARL